MSTTRRTWSLLAIMLMGFRLSFLFLDNLFSAPTTNSLPTDLTTTTTASLPGENPDSIASTLDTTTSLSDQVHNAPQENVSASGDFLNSGNQQIPSLPQQRSLEELRLLESLYKKHGDVQILASLVQGLATNYQFTDAYTYAKELMKHPGYEKILDVKTLLYIFLHSDDVSLESDTSIQTVLTPYLQQWREENLLTQDDVAFYQGLFGLWRRDYAQASASFQTIRTVSYLPVIQAYQSALGEATAQSGVVPAYYKDALVGLVFLKHGYFAVAKKLALSALAQDKTYVLPYQVLAYANFLSTHRDAAAQYFVNLVDLDAAHSAQYTFLVGVSYYWLGNYTQAMLYFNQVQDPSLQTDVYRYQLLSSLAMQDSDGAVRVWQKLLGQADISSSDFADFFDQAYFFPYREGQPFTLYNQNTQLATLYMQSCTQHFSGQQDICLYGQIGQSLLQQNWTGLETSLLYLSTRYHQSYLYHVLGDYYVTTKQYNKAKDAYSQALSICDDANEEILLQHNLQKVLDLS